MQPQNGVRKPLAVSTVTRRFLTPDNLIPEPSILVHDKSWRKTDVRCPVSLR